jgi:hypothetical protein
MGVPNPVGSPGTSRLVLFNVHNYVYLYLTIIKKLILNNAAFFEIVQSGKNGLPSRQKFQAPLKPCYLYTGRRTHHHILQDAGVINSTSVEVPHIPSPAHLVTPFSQSERKLFVSLEARVGNLLSLLSSFEKLRKRLLVLSCLSVRPSFCLQWNSSTSTGRMFIKVDI